MESRLIWIVFPELGPAYPEGEGDRLGVAGSTHHLVAEIQAGRIEAEWLDFVAHAKAPLCGIAAGGERALDARRHLHRGGRRIPVDCFCMLPGNSGQDCFDVPPSAQ